MSRRCLLVPLVALTLVSLAVGSGVAAAAPPPPVDHNAMLRIAHGEVKRPGGSPLSGAKVYWLPEIQPSELGSARVGQTWTQTPQVITTTDKGGRFSASAVASTVLDEDGLMNGTLLISRDSWLAHAEIGKNPARMTVGSSARSARTAPDDEALTLMAENTGNPVPLKRAEASIRNTNMKCKTAKRADFGKSWVQLSRRFIRFGVASNKFSFTRGAVMTLGIAISAKGKVGTWKVGVSGGYLRTRKSSVTLNFRTVHNGYRADNTQFTYGQYYTRCTLWTSTGKHTNSWHRIVPQKFVGSMATFRTGLPIEKWNSREKCGEYQPGQNYVASDSKAQTMTRGVTVSKGPLSLELSSSAGYTQEASMSFTFKKPGRLCGTLDYPAEQKGRGPGSLVASRRNG